MGSFVNVAAKTPAASATHLDSVAPDTARNDAGAVEIDMTAYMLS
jgi:hypothetical protein